MRQYTGRLLAVLVLIISISLPAAAARQEGPREEPIIKRIVRIIKHLIVHPDADVMSPPHP